jgi:purine-nucleoside phosphorylase
MDYYDQVKAAADALRDWIGEVPSIGIVLGSGLGSFVESLQGAASMAYDRLPHWPASRVPGHDGRVVVGKMSGRTVIALSGRCHVYEGHSLPTVAFAVRVLGLLGVRILILTNAAGAVHAGFEPGDLMVIDDHVNLMGSNPLVGPNDDRFGQRFPDMSQVYAARLRRIADLSGAAAQVAVMHGIYAAVPGPCY